MSHDDNKIRQLAEEIASRKREALRLYVPNKIQERYHASTKAVTLLMAGNQFGKAVRHGEPVLTPAGWVPIEELRVGDTVYGSDGSPCQVTGVFPQGERECYRMHFDDQSQVDVCGEHLWKAKIGKRERFGDGGWGIHTTQEIIEHGGLNPSPGKRAIIPVVKPIQFAGKRLPLSPYVLGVLLGDGGLSSGVVQFTTADKEIAIEVSREIPREAECVKLKSKYGYSIRGLSRGKNVVLDAIRELGLCGKRSFEKHIPRDYLFADADARLALLQGLMDTDGSASQKTKTSIGGAMEYCTTSPVMADDFIALVRSLGGKAKCKWRVTKFTHKGQTKCGMKSARISVRLPHLQCFRLARKQRLCFAPTSTTNDRVLYKIEPIGKHHCTCISVTSPDRTFITRDYIVTHNSLAGFVELARAVTGQDPHNKYPKEDGIAIVVGYEERHIGLVIYKYLFKRGAFKIIKDLQTGEWRSYRPWEQSDIDRKDEAKPAPPLIPMRFVKKFAWLKKSKNIFSQVEFTNGWVLHAGNSTGEVIQGIQADLVHFDEDIERAEWYDEMAARLLMRNGRIRWTAMPHEKNTCIDTICNRADSGDKDFEVIQATIFDNPYMSDEARQKVIKTWKDQGHDVYRRRALGERTTDTIRMYGQFSEISHSAINPDEATQTPLQKVLTRTVGEIPEGWCHYMSVDPGHTVCAVTFYAIPPPSLGSDQIVCYDECYIEGATASVFAKSVEPKIKKGYFHAFIIDKHGGRLREIGTGILPEEQYSAALKELGLESHTTGSGFLAGLDHIAGRETNLRECLSLANGHPQIVVVPERVPNLVREMKAFKKKKIRGIVTDTGDRTGNTHAVETLEYAAAANLQFHKPPPPQAGLTPLQLAKGLIDRLERMVLGSAGQTRDRGIYLAPQGSRNYVS